MPRQTGRRGTSMGGMEVSDRWKRRKAIARLREEAEWRARNGPVTVRKVGDPEPEQPEVDRM